MRFSVSETGSCSENEMVYPAVKRPHPAVVIIERKPFDLLFLFSKGLASFIPSARGKGGFFFEKKKY